MEYNERIDDVIKQLDQNVIKVKSALFNLGFRVFFFCAACFSVISVGIWWAVYFNHIALPLGSITPFQWHAHEMIYGYSLAVIAGFLLTATKNWTGKQTLYGLPLLVLASLWVLARVAFSIGAIMFAAAFDLLFLVYLLIGVTVPIIQVKQWRQMAVLGKLVFLLAGNLLFYFGVLGLVDNGIYLGIYGGLYLIVGLIMTIGRRVVPLFIKSGIGMETMPYNNKYLDACSLFAFLLFFVLELAQIYPVVTSYLALLLFVVNAARLIGWYDHRIWHKPLVWVLYLSMWFISLGFLLFFLSNYINVSVFIVIHVWAYAGIGMITLGMMSRVALGHSGRSIHQPPKLVGAAFIVFVLGAVVRVVLPLILPAYYSIWVGGSQALWIVAFLIFLYVYTPMLFSQRIDGKEG